MTPIQPTTQVGSDEAMYIPACSIFRRFLKKQGLKFTPERAKILDAVLAKEEDPVLAWRQVRLIDH